MSLLFYIFDPLPPPVGYQGAKVLLLLAVGLLLVVGSFALRVWRKRQVNGVTRKLSRSWAAASLSFGLTCVVLVVARTESVLLLSMRFLWVLWIAALLFYVFLQYKLFTSRHYEVVGRTTHADPREKYLPGKKKKA